MKKISILVGFSILFTGITFAQKRVLGAKLDKEKMKASFQIIDKPFGFGTNLPKSATLEAYLPKVGDQGNFSNCVGWSASYYASTVAFLISADSLGIRLPEEHAFDPFAPYDMTHHDEENECSFNGSIVDGLIRIRDHNDAIKKLNINPGSCEEVEYSGKNVFDVTETYYIYDWYEKYDSKLTAICQQIVNNRPVVIGMSVPTSFFYVGADGLFKPNLKTDQIEGGHAMCLIGYDDNKFGGAFKIVNSWGTNWGDNGFVWIKYVDFFNYVDEAYYFDFHIRNSLKNKGCVFGNCEEGYGVQNIAGKKGAWGLTEGYFANGKMVEGIFYTPVESKDKLVGKKFIDKTIKKEKENVKLIFDGSRTAGFILKK